jgi:hypothetical protein
MSSSHSHDYYMSYRPTQHVEDLFLCFKNAI